jgi:hypothetical protein
MGKSGYIFLLALTISNMFVQGPLLKLVRSRYGQGAGTRFLDGARDVYLLIVTVWASVAWGFLWRGAGIGAVSLLVVAGTWLYRRRAVMRLRPPAGQQPVPDPRESA